MTKTPNPHKIKSKSNSKIKATIKNTNMYPNNQTLETESPSPTIQNLCICCNRDMGPENPRQFCRKTYCDELCVKCNNYCGGYC